MNHERLRRIRNWQSHEWYAALVIRPLAILVMLVIADWRWVTPNRLTTVSILCKLLSAAAILAGWAWSAALLLQLGVLFDHLDGTMARYRGAGSAFGNFYDKVGDAITWFVILLAAGWTLAARDGSALPVVLAATGAYAVLTLGYMKWVAEASRPRPPSPRPAASTAPPERTGAEWLRWFLGKLAQLPRFEEVDLFFWLGLALVVDRVLWFLWVCAVTQVIGVVVMAVRRGRELARADAARAAPAGASLMRDDHAP